MKGDFFYYGNSFKYLSNLGSRHCYLLHWRLPAHENQFSAHILYSGTGRRRHLICRAQLYLIYQWHLDI